jgi:hypothetical protein
MNVTDKLLVSLLTKYKAEKDIPIELEIRFRSIKRDTFAEIFKVLNSNKEFVKGNIEYTINTISQNVFEKTSNVQYIRRQTFSLTGQKTKDEYVQKQKLLNPVTLNDYLTYVVTLSREGESRKFSSQQDALVRFKIRASFIVDTQWRFDLTAVRTGVINNIADQVVKLKDKLFVPRTFDNFISSLDEQLIDAYEVEIEHIGDRDLLTIESFKIVNSLFSKLNPNYIIDTVYQDEIYHIAQYIKDNKRIHHLFKEGKRLKDLANQAKTINKYTYATEIFPPTGYYLTDKADGIRALISINNGRCRIISDTLTEYTLTDAKPGITIADCELVVAKKGGQFDAGTSTTFVLYVFDVMVLFNDNISQRGFSIRVDKLKTAADLINTFVTQHGGKAIVKNYVRLDADLENAFKTVYNKEFSYEIDGLIITSPNQSYEETSNYKWKPYDHNTIDFIAVECPSNVMGKYPYIKRTNYKLYLLFNSIRYDEQLALGIDTLPFIKSLFLSDNTSERFPIQFSPSINPLAYIYYHSDKDMPLGERNLIELKKSRDIKQPLMFVENNWDFIRIRSDRLIEKNYFGNSYHVAEITYMNYIDEFKLDDLWNPSIGYFSKVRDNIYRASNKYKRFVIGKKINENMALSEWIIDLASGRGADLFQYLKAGIKRAVFIDQDKSALAELVNRKYELSLAKKDNKPFLMYILEQNLTDPFDAVNGRILTFTHGALADSVICNFAIHYFCNTAKNIKNFLQLVAKSVKVNGLFMYTTMNGDAVFKQLKDVPFNGQWIVKENGVVKYAIEKKYSSDSRLLTTGQIIAVKLPLSDEMYEEPLANIDHINSILKSLGFQIEVNSSFAEFDTDFKSVVKKDIYDELTADDKTVIAMHQLVIARKIK